MTARMPPRITTRRAALRAGSWFGDIVRPFGIVWAAVLVLPMAAATAQPPEVDSIRPQAASPQPPAPRVEEVAPELFYLEDDTGNLVPVPGFRYRDFVELLRLKEGLPGLPEAPAAVIESIRIRCDLTGDEAAGGGTCPITAEIVVRQLRSGWAGVPLELGGLLLTSPVRHEGPGRVLLTAEPEASRANRPGPRHRGYRAWFDNAAAPAAAADGRHTITLEGRIAVESSPTHESIALHLPNATASLVELRTVRVDPLVTVRPPSIEPTVKRSGTGPEAGSVVSLVGLSGPTHVRLGERGPEGPGIGAVPQSTVESLVRIDGKVAATEAMLRLENLPADVSTLHIALPPRTAVRGVRSPATLVEREGSDDAPVAVVRVDRGADGRAVIELDCEQPIDPTGRKAFEPFGFAVREVPQWRQWGRASLVVEGDWQVEWDDPGSNRRIDPPLSARRPGFVAAFSYDAQPASLPMRVRPRGSRVVIEPDYRYEVGAARIALDARLRVSVRGAPVSRIVVGLDGWAVDEVGPASLVDTAAITSDGGRLVIPFVQGLAGDAVVDIRCGRPIERAADRVGWKIPSPRADLVGPASVIVVAESDIELLPDADAIRGLVRQVAPTPLQSDVDRAALAYRVDGAEGVFEATRRFLPRRVDAAVTAQVDVDESAMVVRETIRLDVSHVPMEFIELLVPETVWQSGSLEVRQDGQLLNPIDAGNAGAEPPGGPPTAAAETAAGGRRVRSLLARPLLGAGDISVGYELPTPTVPPETAIADDLPLVAPAGVKVVRQTVLLGLNENLSIDLRGEAWKRDAGPQAAAPARTWTATKPQDFVPLAIAARQRSRSGETVVEAAWLQTRLLDDRREDICTYSLVSAGERISLVLPAGFLPSRDGRPDTDGVEVRLDGRLLADAVGADRQIVVELPREAGRTTWLLEIRGSRPRDRWSLAGGLITGLPLSVRFEPPVFAEGTLLRRFYWDLRFESDEHIVVPPRRWTSQQRWDWTRAGFERVPIVSREVLDEWVRADTALAFDGGPRSTGRASGLPVAERRAVYSGVGPPGAARVWVMPTWLLVLAVSGPVLATGLAMLYRPSFRRTSVVLPVAACLAMAAAVVPDLAPLAVQAAIPGAALSLLAVLLRGFLDHDTDRRSERVAAAPRHNVAVVSASSMTRTASPPSLIVARSSLRAPESVTTPGRSAS